MKRTTKYVGLDVHQASTVASVREDSGRVIARSVLPTEGPALTELVRGMRGAVHVALEEGTQAQWVHELLTPLVHRVLVCDRRGEARRGPKGDHADADALAEALRRGGLRAVYHGSSPHRTTLKELTRAYQQLVEDATRVMLRLKALFRARAIPTPGAGVYHPRERAQWLAWLTDRGARFRGGGPVRSTRSAPRAAAEGQGGHAGRGPARSRVARVAGDPLPRAGPGGAPLGHAANPVALSDPAAPLGLRGAGGGDPLQR